MKELVLALVGVGFILVGFAGYQAEATTTPIAEEEKASRMLFSIDNRLRQIRPTYQQRQLTLLDVADQLDAMQKIEDSINRFSAEFAHTATANSFVADSVIERHKAGYHRLQKMHSRLSRQSS